MMNSATRYQKVALGTTLTNMHRSSTELGAEEKDDLLSELSGEAIPNNHFRKSPIAWQVATVTLAFFLLMETIFIWGLIFKQTTHGTYESGYVNEFGKLDLNALGTTVHADTICQLLSCLSSDWSNEDSPTPFVSTTTGHSLRPSILRSHDMSGLRVLKLIVTGKI